MSHDHAANRRKNGFCIITAVIGGKLLLQQELGGVSAYSWWDLGQREELHEEPIIKIGGGRVHVGVRARHVVVFDPPLALAALADELAHKKGVAGAVVHLEFPGE